MSRRKQAKPRSFKPVEELIENLGTHGNNPQDGSMCEVEESVLISLTSPVNDDGSNTNVENLFSAPSPTHDSSESEAPCTDQGSSWRSETPEDPQTSPAPSSCATPNSATDLPDAELSYTVGITEATPYACQFCDKAFPRLSFLKKHEQIHGDHMPFRCEFCSRLFKHKRSRDRHIKLHTGDKKYRCNHCDAAFSRSDHLKIHMKTHDTQKPFQCTVCNRGYNTAAALTSHMQNHKRQRPETPSAVRGVGGASSSGRNTSNASEESIPSPSNFRCVHCDESFPKNDHLQNHILTVHSNELLSADDCIRSGVPVSLSDPRLPAMSAKLACIYCTKDSFTTMEQLQLHVQAMHSSILNGDLRDFSHSRDRQGTTPSPTNTSGGSRQRNMSNMMYPCDMCTMRFSTQRRLKKHTMSIHRNYQSHGNLYLQTPLICLQCSLPFHTSAAFAEHYLLVHGSSSPSLIAPAPEQVKPTDLSRKTPRSDSEERKTKRLCTDDSLMRTELISPIATPQYEYPGMLLCNQCDAALPDFESFRTHLKTHLEQDGGAQRFLQASGMNVMDTLSQDRMSLHSNSCICPHCGATFKDLTTCEQHVITHFLATTTEYGCQSCMKKFSKPDELQKHLMDIHAHHLYRCSLCKEMFDSKVAIQVHFSVNHMNECKLYQCTACPNATSLFHIEQEFGLHVRTIHGSQTLLSAMQAQSKNLYCMFCRQTFGSELELQFHLATHSKQFRCPICPEVFQIEFLLDRHIQTYHSHSRVSNGDNDNVDGDKSNKKSSSNSPLQVGKTHTPPGRSTQKSSSGENNNVKKPNDSELTNCDICERNDFSNESELVAHRKLVHHIRSNVKNGVVSLHCAYCNENCKTRTELENHMKSHSQSSGVTGKHKCNICDEICASAVLLAEHKLTHCKVISGNSCTQCKSVLTTEVQFYMHLVQHSTNNNGGNQKMKSQVALPTPCIICRQTLISDIEVRIHSQFHIRNTMQHAEYPCSRCLKNVDTQSIIFSDGHHLCPECYSMPGCTQPRTYHCAECQLTFDTNGALEEHTEIVHVKKTYICIKCQASFDNERDVHVHVATHLMTEGSNHECHLCRRLLATPLKLQAHLIEHTFAGCGSFTCYLCSTVFTASQGLLSHMNEHGSAAKPYDCPQCNQKFFFRAELDNHTFSHLGRPSRSSTEVDIPLISPKHYFVSSSGIFDPLKNYDMSVYYIKESQKKKKVPATSSAYKCYNCSQEFTDGNTLQSHRQHCTKNEAIETKNVPASIEKPKEEKEEQNKEEYIEIGSPVSAQRFKTEYQNTPEDGNSTFTSDN